MFVLMCHVPKLEININKNGHKNIFIDKIFQQLYVCLFLSFVLKKIQH